MKPLRIAIAGLGTVGSSVVKLLQKRSDLLVEITVVSSLSKEKYEELNIKNAVWIENAVDLANRDDVDLVCELIGGSDGVAYDLCKKTLENGKSLVTANKALLAIHGVELAKIAQEKDSSIFYEAAVAGGIPIIKVIKESMSANKISSVKGILNGTCNYILDSMTKNDLEFNEALEKAKDLGYAEADPSADIDGADAAHKLAILTSLAYGVLPDLNKVTIEGIRNITKDDIKIADDLGYVIRLIGSSIKKENFIEQIISPFLLKKGTFFSSIDNVLNAIKIHGDFVGDLSFIGAGAGGDATASAVVADIIDFSKNIKTDVFLKKVSDLETLNKLQLDKALSNRYIRVKFDNNDSLYEKIQSILKEMEIPVETILQKEHQTDSNVVVITKSISDVKASDLMERINQLKDVKSHLCLRIENLGENNA